MLFQTEMRTNFQGNNFNELQSVCCLCFDPEADPSRAGHGMAMTSPGTATTRSWTWRTRSA